MTDNYPPPVQKAIDAAYRIRPEAGVHAQLLIDMLWGDMERIGQVADVWMNTKRSAENRVINMMLEGDGARVQGVGEILDDENWSGDAKDAYVAYLKQLTSKMAKLNAGMSLVGEKLKDAAEVVDQMHDDLVETCAAFVISITAIVAGAVTLNAKVLAAATVATMEFLWKLNSYINSSRTKFNVVINDMRKIKSEIQGLTVDSTESMDPFLPGPVTVTRIASLVPVAEIGNWRNWGEARAEG